MDYFNGALIQPDKSISSEVRNSLIITSNYNLLDDDNISVSWSGNVVSVKRPAGLSNLSKIRYRNFKGSMLPFTTIDLPNLHVEVIVTGNGVDSGYIEGDDGPWPERFEYKVGQKNVLLSFNKAWTYDSNATDQLIYNIEEAVEEVNRRLHDRYPMIRLDKIFGILEDYSEDMTQRIYYTDTIRPVSINVGSYLVGCPSNTGLNTMAMIYVNNGNESLINFSYDSRRPFYLSCSYDMNIIVGCMEYLSGGAYGRQIVWRNTSSTAIPSYTALVIDRGEEWDTRRNRFGIFERSPSMSIGTINGLTSAILSPIVVPSSPSDIPMIITKGTQSSYYYLDFNTNIASDDTIACLGAGDVYDNAGNREGNLMYMLCAYAEKGMDASVGFRIGLFTFDITTLSSDSNAPTVVVSANAYTDIYDYSQFTTYQKAMNGGKETYRVIHFAEGDYNYVWFVGSYLIEYTDYEIVNWCLVPSWKISDNVYLTQINDGSYQSIDFSVLNADGIKNMMKYIIQHGGYDIKTPTSIHMSDMSPPYMIKDLSDNTTIGYVQNPNWLETSLPSFNYNFNEQHLPNALRCAVETEFNLKSQIKVGETTHNLLHNINGDAIAVSDTWFEFLPDGTLRTSQIQYDSGYNLAFSLNIYTDPYYFSFRSPIQYFSGYDTIIHPIVAPFFSTLNSHVLSTINILILMKYEFNDIELTCNNFPNNNGVIFHLNEESQVEFKEMMTDNTQDDIKLQLISKNEPLTLPLLQSLYGNISISLDWVCF